MKQRYLRLSILGSLLGFCFIGTSCNGQDITRQEADNQNTAISLKSNDELLSIYDSTGVKEGLTGIYTDSATGISFQYPKDWRITTANQQNLKGEITVYTWSLENSDKDSLIQFNLHLPPLGAQLYSGIKSQAKSSGFNSLIVNNLSEVIQTKTQRETGKGNALSINQEVTTAYCFVSKSGELMEVILKTSVSDKKKSGDFIRDFIAGINLNQ